jgi:hypothetical protein
MRPVSGHRIESKATAGEEFLSGEDRATTGSASLFMQRTLDGPETD